jgi:hypothetical protein
MRKGERNQLIRLQAPSPMPKPGPPFKIGVRPYQFAAYHLARR